MTEKNTGTLNAFMSETGKVFANVQERNEGGKGAQFTWRRITMGAPNGCGGRRKLPRMSKYFLQSNDLRFENGKLASCPGPHLTS